MSCNLQAFESFRDPMLYPLSKLNKTFDVAKTHKFCYVIPFSNLYIGLKSTNALHINFCLLPLKPLLILLICTADVPRATRSSSSVVTLSRPPTSSSLRITNRSFRYASAHLWNQLAVSLTHWPCIKHLADDVTLSYSPAHHSHPPLHIHCFIPGSKHVFHISFPP